MALQGQCKVYIAFSDGPMVEPPTWTEVTSYVRSVSVNRGRSTELDAFQTGTASVVLDNRLRTFDPEYSSGPYYGNIKVRRQIKIEGFYNAVTYPIFRGFIQSWDQHWPGIAKDATTTVSAVDLFALLSSWELPQTAYELVVRQQAPSAFWGLDGDGLMVDRTGLATGSFGKGRVAVDALAANGAGASRHSVNPGESTGGLYGGGLVGTFGAFGSTSTNVYSITALVNIGSFFNYESGYVAWDMPILICGLNGPNIWMHFGLGATGTLMAVLYRPHVGTSTHESTVTVNDGATHHVAVVRNGATVKLYIDGVEAYTTGAATTTSSTVANGYIGAGAEGVDGITGTLRWHQFSVDEVAVWQGTALTADQVAAQADAFDGFYLDTVDGRLERMCGLLGVPNGLCSLDVASASVDAFYGGTDLLSYMQTVAASDSGRFFINQSGYITFQSRTANMGASSTLTFADDTTANSVRYTGFELELDTRLVFNRVTVKGAADEAEYTARNETSIAEYLPLSTEIKTQLVAAACQDVAETVAQIYSDPVVRGRAWKCYPERALYGTSTLGYASILGVELGDIVTVVRTPPVGSALSKTVQVTAISHTIDVPEGEWVVTFLGAPADTSAAFRWGTSTWGGSDKWNTNS